MGGSDNKGDGLASQPRCYRVPGQPLLNPCPASGGGCLPQPRWAVCATGAGHQGQPIRGRPAVRGRRTCGGRPGQRVEEQGTWASRTQKHSEAGYGRPVDRGAWTAKTVKRPWQQPAQPQHTNYWAPQRRERHQREHRPQRPAESSDPTQHAKGRTGDCPGPRKGTTTRRNVTQGVKGCSWAPPHGVHHHRCGEYKQHFSALCNRFFFAPPPPPDCGLCQLVMAP